MFRLENEWIDMMKKIVFSKLWKYNAYYKVRNIHLQNKGFGRVYMNKKCGSCEKKIQRLKDIIMSWTPPSPIVCIIACINIVTCIITCFIVCTNIFAYIITCIIICINIIAYIIVYIDIVACIITYINIVACIITYVITNIITYIIVNFQLTPSSLLVKKLLEKLPWLVHTWKFP